MSLFTIAKTWRQTKCPSIEEWIKKMYMHIVGYYSAIKKNEMMPLVATQMDLKIIIVGQPEKGKYMLSQISYVITHMWDMI